MKEAARGLSQRTGVEGRRPDGGDQEGLSRCSPATGRTRWSCLSLMSDENTRRMSTTGLEDLHDRNQTCR
jgi:hypothetical protein